MVDVELLTKSPRDEFGHRPTTTLEIGEILRRKIGTRRDLLLRQALLGQQFQQIGQAPSAQILQRKGCGSVGHRAGLPILQLTAIYHEIYTAIHFKCTRKATRQSPTHHDRSTEKVCAMRMRCCPRLTRTMDRIAVSRCDRSRDAAVLVRPKARPDRGQTRSSMG